MQGLGGVRALKLPANVALALCAATALHAGDWPQFRGPTGQGHAPDGAVPLTWSETENVAWKTAVPGRGWSSPVIAGGLAWLTTAVTDREAGTSLRLLAYDVGTGDAAMDVEVFAISDTTLLNQKNSLASPTPAIDPDGERVYVHFGAQGTAAVAAGGASPGGAPAGGVSAGEVLWRARFPYTSQHGNGGSPIFHDGLLIVSIDGYDTAFLVAVDAGTGEERWRSVRPKPISQAYSTPLAIRVGAAEQIIGVSAFRTTAHEPATGREIWRVEYPGGFSTSHGLSTATVSSICRPASTSRSCSPSGQPARVMCRIPRSPGGSAAARRSRCPPSWSATSSTPSPTPASPPASMP